MTAQPPVSSSLSLTLVLRPSSQYRPLVLPMYFVSWPLYLALAFWPLTLALVLYV